MPVRQMTEEEKVRFFGSGFVIFGMKRPSRSANQYVAGHTQEHVTGSRGLSRMSILGGRGLRNPFGVKSK